MHRRYQLIALAAAAALVALFMLHSSEEDRILEQLENLRALAEIHSQESSIEMLVKSRLLGDFFTEKSHYDLTSSGQRLYEVHSRQELVQHIAGIRAKLASLELALQDMEVRIEGDTARVRLQGTGLGSMRGGEGQFLEIHTVEVLLQKRGDTWLVSGGRHIRNEREPVEQRIGEFPPWKSPPRVAYHGFTEDNRFNRLRQHHDRPMNRSTHENSHYQRQPSQPVPE